MVLLSQKLKEDRQKSRASYSRALNDPLLSEVVFAKLPLVIHARGNFSRLLE